MPGDLSQTESLDHRGAARATAGAPQLVRLVEGHRPTAGSSRHLLDGTEVVTIGRGAGAALRRDGGLRRELVLTVDDNAMSAPHARLLKVTGRWVVEDQRAKNGTIVNGLRVGRAVLADGDLVELGRTLFRFRDAVVPLPGEPDLYDVPEPLPGLPTLVTSFSVALAGAAQAARASLPVLVLGESGTGKEVVARGLHTRSGRTGPFVAVNCAALPEHLVEATLFGHRKGAFSGALDDRPGLLRSADGGTLLLDEIGELRAPAQAALLRALQEREVLPVGETRPVKIDVRVIAATNRDLEAAAGAGEFRRDLLARLGGLVLRLPPVAERREDLGLLVAALLARHAPAATLTPAAARALAGHHWPLNVRELEMALAGALAQAPGRPIDLPVLPAAVVAALGEAGGAVRDGEDDAPLSADEQELRATLVAQLTLQGGNVSAVARVMGKGREQIHRWLRRFGLDLDDFRS